MVPGNPQPAEVRRLWLFLLGEGKFTRDQRRKKIQKLFIYSTNFVIVERRINSLKSNDSSQENISQVVREDFILFSGGLGTPRHKDKKEKGGGPCFIFGGMHVGCPVTASHNTMYTADSERSFITPLTVALSACALHTTCSAFLSMYNRRASPAPFGG